MVHGWYRVSCQCFILLIGFKIACYDCIKIILRQNTDNKDFSESRDLIMIQGLVVGQNINFTKVAIVNVAACIGGLGAIPPGQHQLPPSPNHDTSTSMATVRDQGKDFAADHDNRDRISSRLISNTRFDLCATALVL